MGFSSGVDKEATLKLKKAGLKILVVPFAVALGSILGGLIDGLILGINVLASMAVSAGFGWYMLAGPRVGQLFFDRTTDATSERLAVFWCGRRDLNPGCQRGRLMS
jgi:hypothetical protein